MFLNCWLVDREYPWGRWKKDDQECMGKSQWKTRNLKMECLSEMVLSFPPFSLTFKEAQFFHSQPFQYGISFWLFETNMLPEPMINNMVFMNLLYPKEMIHDGGGFDSLETMSLCQSRHSFVIHFFLHPFSDTKNSFCQIWFTICYAYPIVVSILCFKVNAFSRVPFVFVLFEQVVCFWCLSSKNATQPFV